jgi:DNA-binding transcriptional LysR family regulator
MRMKPQSSSTAPATGTHRPERSGNGLSLVQDIAAIRPLGELIQHRSFATVAEVPRFAPPSERLRVDPPVLSGRIWMLESNSGLRSFERGQQKVELAEPKNATFQFADKALSLSRGCIRPCRLNLHHWSRDTTSQVPALILNVPPSHADRWRREDLLKTNERDGVECHFSAECQAAPISA